MSTPPPPPPPPLCYKFVTCALILASAPCCNRSRWTLQPGSLTVLMGANGSGKSTLGMAWPATRTTRSPLGKPLLGRQRPDGQLPAHERARTGLFVSFQSPPDIPGVKNNLFDPHRPRTPCANPRAKHRWMRLTF